MAVYCEFINFIIPIKNIDSVYPGGFEKFKSDNLKMFKGRYWHDEFLFRDGAMNSVDISELKKHWEKMGLIGIEDPNGEKKWKDFCVVDSVMGPTLPCEWLRFDGKTSSASFKEACEDDLKGPNR